MYAIIEAGSRQFKVKEGDTLVIDRVSGSEGENYKFDKVMMIGGGSPKFGAPYVEGAFVEAKIKAHSLDKKINVFKYKRKKNYKVTHGHRQPITTLEIGKISG